MAPIDNGSGITAKFGPNLMLQCDVWLYADQVSDFVRVAAFACPDGFDASNPAAGDKYTTCCAQNNRGVDFESTVDGVLVEQGAPRGDDLATTPTQPGQWRITAAPGEGEGVTFVTCDQTLAALNQVQTIEPTINSDGRSVTLGLDEGDSLRCDFFLSPMAATADASAGEEPTDVGEAPPAGDHTTEPTDNTEPTEPIDITEPADTTEPTETNPAGGTFGGGSGAPRGDTGTVGTIAAPADSSGDDDSTDASAAGESSELSIQHWDCPDPVATATPNEMVESCTASLEPSMWELNGEPLDVGDGYAHWDGLEPGNYVVGNGAAAGKDDTASGVYCSVLIDEEPVVSAEVVVRDGEIEVVFDLPAVVYCNWFVAA